MKRFTDLHAVISHIEYLMGAGGWPNLAKYIVYALMRDEYIITAPDGYYWREASDDYWVSILQEGLDYAA